MSGLDECHCACYGTKWKHKHVPVEGEFLVQNGTIYPVIEVDSRDHTDEYHEYAVYTQVDDEGGKVTL